jgi:hypothetical protein
MLQAISQSTLGQQCPEPANIAGEKEWLKRLFNDEEFKRTFDSIDWNSQEMKNIYFKIQHP